MFVNRLSRPNKRTKVSGCITANVRSATEAVLSLHAPFVADLLWLLNTSTFAVILLAVDCWISRISQPYFLQFSDRFTMTITSTNVRKTMLHHAPVGTGLSLCLKQKWTWKSYLHFQDGLVWGDIWCGPCSPVCRAQPSFLSAQWITAPVVNIKHYSPSPQPTYVSPINKKQNRVNLILF